MYKIIMVSPGGTKKDFQGGFNSAKEAEDVARESGYEYCDENGFVWRLDVVDDYDDRMVGLTIPNVDWAKTFLEFREHGDDQALLFLDDVMENTFNRWQRLKYTAIRRLVRALVDLNHIVVLMEMDEIPYESVIEEAYRNMMRRLCEVAENSQDIV